MMILALLNCVHDYGRRALEGIARYGHAHGTWTLSLHHEEQVRQVLPRLDPRVRGIVAHAYGKKLLAVLRGCGLPTVNTSAVAAGVNLPSVLTDNRAIGAMAADYFVTRGHRRLMVVEHPPWAHSVERSEAFRRAAAEAGVETTRVVLPSWKRAEAAVADALRETPTPVGCFTGSDGIAVFAVRQALELGLAIPEQVAVLGVDNDTLTTRMMTPTISSIEVPWEKLGFEAAATLDRLMGGGAPPDEPMRVAPTGVVTRQTTDGLAVEDEDVAAAVGYVRRHVGEPFSIDDLLRDVPLSRRALELRFKRGVGRTLQAYITAARIERAKRLLTETDYAMPVVAERSGFADAGYFATVFRRQVGQTPSAFRSRYRLS
ncbi:MAG: substrate-binding domain-containing protein [Planctomycetota bacterium]